MATQNETAGPAGPEARPLVAFYSLAGTTRRLAEALADALDGDRLEIVETRPRRVTPWGMLRCLLDGVRGRSSPVEPPGADLAGRLVVVGGPVWAGGASGPVLGFLAQNRDRLGPVAGFCTSGSGDPKRTFERMEAALGRPLAGRLSIKGDRVGTAEAAAEVRAFAETVS